MRQLIKKFLCIVVLASGLQLSYGFSLLGPTGNGGDSWQTGKIGYGLAYGSFSTPGGPVFLGDIGAPKNIGEGYRRNAPVLYYAYDANFLGFFDTIGATNADGAFAIMNSLTNVDNYSSSLSEFPLQSQVPNYTAQALYLTDLKSVTLHLLVEQMGLADPQRYSWTLVEDYLPPGDVCPNDNLYLLTQRNFDLFSTSLSQSIYSASINNSLYSYYIVEECVPPDPVAFTEIVPTDPLAFQYSAVACNTFSFNAGGGGLTIGNFYTGLTRDDVAGLRYLLSTNNVDTETAALGSVLQSTSQAGGTNYGTPYLLYTSDLTAFAQAAYTNSPVILSNLYPGLIITSTKIGYLVEYATTQYVAYYTNQIGAPIGSPLVPVYATTSTPYVLTVYTNTYANVVTNHYNPNSSYFLYITNVTKQTGAPVGSPLITNATLVPVTVTGVPSGDFYINTNACGPGLVLEDLLTNVTTFTNTTLVTTNSTGFYSTSQIISSNSVAIILEPVVCSASSGGGTTTNSPGLYQGIGNVKFVRADFDSLISQYWRPVTNNYTMVSISGAGQAHFETFQRIVTQPDILLTAQDDVGGNTFNGTVTRDINFDTQNVLPGLAGPGVINTPTTLSYNKLGAAYWNGPRGSANGFLANLNPTNQINSVAWASFDGSSNAPIVYPSSASIANLQNLILIQISPATLPNGTKNAAYPATTFTATGGSISYSPAPTWSLVNDSGTLPPGLTLSATGTISGTPTASGTYDFLLQLTDTNGRTVQWNYSITIQ